MFPPAFQALGGMASSVVPFSSVHVLLQHSDGTVALDSVLDFPSGAQSISLDLSVPLLADAPAGGEPMTLTLSYLNGTGNTVFQGGPVTVTVAPAPAGGGANPPIQIPVRYTGPGYNAATVVIAPRGTTVSSGSPFSFSAVAKDGAGVAIPNTPIVWTSLDPTIASVTAMTAGAGVAGLQRGGARIVAQLLTGPADTVMLNVTLPATQIIAQGGSGQTGTAGTQLAQPLVAKVEASDGVGVAGVTVTFAVATGGGTVANPSVVSDANGLAQTTWKLGPAAGTQSVTASAGTLTNSPLTYTALATAAPATKLVVTTPPSNGTAGAPLAPIGITAEDNNGNIATSFTGPVTLSLGANPTGATLGGTLTVNAVGGVATFSDISLSKAAIGYTLIANSGTLTPVTTTPFDIIVGAATQLVVISQPTGGSAGATLAPVTLAAEDRYGNVATSFTGAVTLALGSGPLGAALGGTLSVNAVAGVATFSTLSVSKSGVGYTLTGSSAGLTGVTTSSFNISAAASASLVFTIAPPASTVAGTAFAPALVVTAVDALGNVTPSFIGTVTLSFGTNPTGAALGGTTITVNAVAGVATFPNVFVTRSGSGYTLTAAATGLTGATSRAFAITAGSATQLVVSAQPANGTAGVVMAPIGVTAEDGFGNIATAFTDPVILALNANPGGSTLGGTLPVAAVSGVATFGDISLNKAATGYTLNASSGVLTAATTTTFDVGAGPAASIAINSGNNQTARVNTALPTPLSVIVRDANGNAVAGVTVQFAVVTGHGGVSAASAVSDANGVASTNWTLGSSVGTQTVSASVTGLTGSPLTFSATARSGDRD